MNYSINEKTGNVSIPLKESDLENDFCSGILQVENRAFLTYIDCSYISIYDSVEDNIVCVYFYLIPKENFT